MSLASHETAFPAQAETVSLGDGGWIRVRPVRSTDKAGFVRAFNRLSSLSRYRRFLGHKRALSDAELRLFTEVDGHDHYALVAVKPGAAGHEGEVVGAARFIRLDDQPETAEIAVAVVDDHQRRGIGRLLLERLSQAAFERGIRKIRVHLLAENLPVRRLLDALFGGQSLEREGEIISGEIPLLAPETLADRVARAPLFELLRLAAEEAVMPINLSLILSQGQLSAFKRRLSNRQEEQEPDAD